MAKNIIKLTESELEGLVKKIMLEENRTPSKKLKSSKSLNEGRELLRKFHNKKKSLVREGYSKKEINEQLGDFLGMTDDSPISDIGMGSAKQWMISWVLGQLNVSGELNKILSIALSKAKPKDYVKLFDPVDNCDFLADLVFDTFLQYMIQKLVVSIGARATSGSGPGVSSFASSDLFSLVAGNALMRLVKNNEFKVDLQKIFKRTLCEALGGRSSEAELSSELERSEMSPSLIKNIKSNL